MDVSKDRWKIGELAAATGLTVRTLHHYDEIELLRPSQRSEAGHRIYTEEDMQRLYRLLEIMDVMMETERYYTPEQREQTGKRGDEADWYEIERNQKEWSRILEDAEAALKNGTPATDPEVRQLARRYHELGQWFAAGSREATRT